MRNPTSNLHRFSKKTKNQSINKDTQIIILKPIYDIYRRILESLFLVTKMRTYPRKNLLGAFYRISQHVIIQFGRL